jgi:hypothetical protein
MKTEWRPEGWEETCDCKDLPPEQQCSMYKNFEAGASAMLAARDKEWVGWAQSTCPHNHIFNPDTKEFDEDTLKLECYQCWQERREEIGNGK